MPDRKLVHEQIVLIRMFASGLSNVFCIGGLYRVHRLFRVSVLQRSAVNPSVGNPGNLGAILRSYQS